MQVIISIFVVILGVFQHSMQHALPAVNLGAGNILDGGPTRPNPGWYWIQIGRYYTAQQFKDECGNDAAPCVPTLPALNTASTTTQFVYQHTKKPDKKYLWGADITVPFILYSRIDKNPLNLTSAGSGLGDINIGTFLQWDPIMYRDRPLFVQRVEFSASFPTGKNRLPCKVFNPGSNCFFINPYWAATYYLSTRWALSWRLHYLWCSKNRDLPLQDGQAIHLNYSFEHEFAKGFWGSVSGYFLQQITDDKLCNVNIPNSRERVFAVGPGALYVFPHEWLLFGYAYFESQARNRPQGFSCVLRLLKHF